MIQLLRRLKQSDQNGNLMVSIAKLAEKEREVRTLEMAIEYISSLEEEDLARVWPRLMAAIYSQTPSTPRRESTRANIHAKQ